MPELFFIFVAFLSLVAFTKWRQGFYLATIVAFLQDPARKLTEEEPAYFIVFTGLVFGAALIGAIHSNAPIGLRHISNWRRFLRTPFMLLMLVIAAQAFQSLARYDGLLIPVLGVVNYTAPFFALALAHAIAKGGTIQRLRSFLRFYVVCAVAALTTVYLQTLGWETPVLGEVGVGIRIYDLGTVLTAYSGTFRASEIAAWHSATCACVILLLVTEGRPTPARLVLALALIAIVLSVGIMTGRRKLLVVFALFVASYVALLALLWRPARSIAFSAVIVGVLAYLVVFAGFGASPSELADRSSEYQLYVQRVSGVFGDVPDRFIELGVAPITWAYNHFGLLGGGIGIGTQGVQYITEIGGHIGAAEGGLGKIMLELGLPGLLAIGALGMAFMRHIWTLLADLPRRSERATRFACGLTAILVANGASFSVATQAYGDIFILLFLGTCLGALLAMPALAERERGEQAHRFMRRLPVRSRAGHMITSVH